MADIPLVQHLIDERAIKESDRLFCAVPKSENIDDGLRHVTYREFANAVNRCAWWLEKELEKSQRFETIAYIGPSDLRYVIITIAANKTGFKPQLLSARNSTAVQLHLLESAECHILLMASDWEILVPHATAIQDKRQLRTVPVASLGEWLDGGAAPLYPFTRDLPEAKHDPFVVLHTSGSTGFPKPVTLVHGAIASLGMHTKAESFLANMPKTYADVWADKAYFLPLPPFHMVGLLTTIALNVYWNMTPILGPSRSVPSAEVIDKYHNLDICDGTILAPGMMEEIAKKPERLQKMRSLKFAIWTGGPFSSPAVGNAIRAKVPISTGLGSTETGVIVLTEQDQDDFEYIGISPMMGIEFRPHSEDLYEMVIVKDPKLKDLQYVFLNFPELSEWPMNDLYSKHPTKPDLWRYRGRSDDIVVLASGLKVNPLAMEGVVMSHPEVIAALITGQYHSQPALLVEVREPPAAPDDAAALLDRIWPTVERANKEGSVHCQLSKDLIIFTASDKPMLRAGKGTVQRRLTIKSYQHELDELYKSRDGS